ncbi:MAG: MBL fold metallo-hydrolase, partial [Candidatus Dadabacteria bacterium]
MLPLKRAAAPAAFLCLVFTCLAGCAPEARNLKLYFPDLGEGSSVIIKHPEKRDLIIIDTGTPMSAPKLRGIISKEKGYKVSLLALTHPHMDHSGGVFDLVSSKKPEGIVDNGEPLGAAGKRNKFFRWYDETIRSLPNYKAIKRGYTFHSGSLSLKALWPATLSGDWNANSLVFLLSYGKFKALLMGDGNRETIKELFKKRSKLKAELLWVGHHGASDSVTHRFLTNVSPKVAVISAGRDNYYGYPSKTTLKELSDLGIETFITGIDGDITVT